MAAAGAAGAQQMVTVTGPDGRLLTLPLLQLSAESPGLSAVHAPAGTATHLSPAVTPVGVAASTEPVGTVLMTLPVAGGPELQLVVQPGGTVAWVPATAPAHSHHGHPGEHHGHHKKTPTSPSK
jgi:hypothetical protein